LESFRNITNVTFPLLLNASDVASDYKTTYDRLVIIDKNGEIVHSGNQKASTDLANVKIKVEDLLGE